MFRGLNNYVAWIIVIFLEWLILRIGNSAHLWIYVIIPIIAAFIYTEYSNKPAKKKRNLR
ncbi:MAG TPA: hypothetical protein GX498_00765 [Clostridiales bacterium]|nr:hypothetical protein [Clostridiales bacterium]